MRRLLALTVAVAVLSAGAACSAERSGSEPTGGPGGSAPSTAAGAGPGAGGAGSGATGSPVPSGAAGGNGPAVCAAAQQASSTAVRTYVAELGRMIGAVGANDRLTAEAARKQAEAALAGWRAALRQQSAQATDPQLRTLLSDLASEVGTLGTDVDAIDEEELDGLQQRLDQLCAR